MDHYEEFMSKERERLGTEKSALETQVKEATARLAAITRELNALTVYEAARKGQHVKNAAVPRGAGKAAIVAVIGRHKGITRGQLITELGIKGDKSKEGGLSNTLSALKKAGTITADGGKYALIPGA